MDKVNELIAAIEDYGFETEGGILVNCVEWIELKAIIQAQSEAE